MDSTEHIRRMDAVKAAEAKGEVADSMEVRLAIMARADAGEITFQEAQDQIRKLKAGAKRQGKTTRSRVYSGR